MLRPDPAQRDRLADICANLTDRIAEAEREGWRGEVQGLTATLSAARDKLARLDQLRTPGPIMLGLPHAGGAHA
ncbi:hypothetical protein [Dactylosporangium sp. NPDC048998]|uniref:hypothetical protein n=1 Tax=Dactylosporangium sp. NPDC048998 TaxID=3363976 RepID=UPI0037132C6B